VIEGVGRDVYSSRGGDRRRRRIRRHGDVFSRPTRPDV
jgi:hypothetical protein